MNIINQIIDIVIEKNGPYKFKLDKSTKIEEDLGITGDDALELIELFIELFKVKYDGFELNKYFDEEGFDLLGISNFIRKIRGDKVIKKSSYELTLGDLEDWAVRGYWKDPT